MQQTTAQQLKYYGRRNRAKQKAGRSEHVLSPGSEDASSAHVDEPAASAGVKLQDVIRVSGHPEISQAGKEWASKPVATSEEEVTPGSDVVKRQMPTTRKNSAIKSPANQGREATREATTGKQVSALEGVSAKKTPEKVRNEEMVIVGIASNGGQEQHGKPKKGAVPVCAGARKTRAQLARDEARRLAVEGQPSQESHDVATPSMVAHHRQEALERRRREHQVLAKANAIWSKREFIEANKDKKLQPKSKEPSRSKPHWDFVLEEMTWLAKDFERERKWKLGQAKKVALRVSRSKLDFEAREIRHQKEEEQRVRRVASGIAKEVKKFWMKVEKLVTYKQQLQIEETKKKALDKHLDFLLGQTERYSTMLAANLADPLVVSDHQSIHLLPPVPLEDDAGAAIGEELYLVSQADVPSKDSKVNDEGRNRDRSVNMDLEGDDEDFILNDEEEQEDDEATLEADEALITEAERTEELGALQRESELPMEELLKIYKTKRESMDQDEEETSEGETDKEQEDDGENDNEDEEVDADDKDLMTTVRADVAEESQCNTEHAWTVGNEAEELTGSSLNIKDTTNVKSEMEDVKSLRFGLVKAANDDSIADEPAKVYKEKGMITTVPGMKTDSQSLQQNNLKLPHADWVVPGHLAEMDQLQVGGELPTLVVELGVDTREDVNISLKARRPQRQRRLLTSSFVHLGIMRDMQDDEDYIPAATADGQEEDDDESTLEEEERQAKEEDTSPENEVDQLRHESEMTLEELLAKYKSFTGEHDQDKEDASDDLDDFLEDRQDRTSEAGTSGSSNEEEEDHLDNAHYIAQANARMGEPSTSGRDHPPEVPLRSMRSVNNQHLVETLELKEESLEGSQMVDMHEGKQKSLDVGGREKNVVLAEITPEVGMLGTSLLLQVDGEVDDETSAAVAKVTEAAKRRGERMVLRTSFALKEATAIHLCSNPDMVEKKDSASVIGTDQVKASASGILRSNDFESESPTASSDDLPDGRVSLNGNNVKTGLIGELALTSDSVRPSLDESNPTCGNVAILDGVMDAAGLMNDGSPQFKKDCTAILEKQKPGEDQGSRESLADAAAAAQSAQPTGYTYSTTKVRTNLPFLLKHSLREYQHIGLDWLVTMYEKRLNGILADEMGLGKTIMTIALLAHLACEKGIWGPHLIVVPTSVMLNWETEFMKWCPAFKILTYFGSAKERKLKRQGWSRTNSFHVCITTYRLVIQDAKAFKRKKWKYLILDEAHLIKNWKSQRWQTLLNFNSKRRILLTGTPLQNDLMELWSLMHFLMPHVFQSHQEFRDWFSNPITGMVEGQEQVNRELVDRLHNVLRPFLLRRLKKDVEKQLPGKFEHVIHCRLSKRQRNLYEDFMASSDTQETLASGNFLGLINVLMQLRKVCNHPDLFEGRPIISSFDMPGIELHLSSAACSALTLDPLKAVGMESVNGYLSHIEHDMALWEAEEVITMKTPAPIIVELASSGEDTWKQCYTKNKPSKEVRGVIEEIQAVLRAKREKQRKERMLAFSILNDMRCSCRPVYGSDLRKLVEVEHPVHDVHKIKANHSRYLEFSSIVADIVKLPLTRCKWMMDLITAFVFAIPAARAPWPSAWCSHPSSCNSLLRLQLTEQCSQEASMKLVPLRPVVVRRQLFFPDRRLLQFDCGKLQELAVLLRRLKSEGHRALIFTQMTKMLDVLEGFISLYGYTYMRLDGSTKPEQRQILMQRFNTNPKIFLFILSTRSGGVGINLVGADTVIFYDSDWNPAMDQQAQDRCHRIGQTREVHIYRLVSESTIEENILKKANQKRILDDLVIQSGSYNTEFFKKLDPMELFSGLKGVKVDGSNGKAIGTAVLATAFANNTSAIGVSEQRELSVADVEAALKNAEDEADYMAMKQVEQEEAAENQEFTEEGFAANIDEEDLADDTEEAGRGGVNPGMVQFESMEVAGALRVEQGAVEALRTTVAEESTFAGTTLLPADVEEDMDMLADVRQMAAAAAAAGREKTSFEDQLRPVERFAMRFLELWDPRAENLAVVAQVAFEEKEWELDQLEKLKEEQEAEMDEENEPLSYENWDTAFANQAYQQQVEVLAQQQENQRQLEWEAMEEELRDADRSIAEAAATVLGAENFSLKSKGKKAKKAKFKSLAEGSLLTAAETEEAIEEYSSDPSYRDSHSDQSHLPHRDPSQRKRMAPKLLEEELLAERHLKKLRREQSKEREVSMEKGKGKQNLSESDLRRSSDDASEFCWPSSTDLEASAVPGELAIPGTRGTAIGGKKKAEGTVSIMGMHPKKGPVIMLEKEKKKDVVKSLEHVPQAAPWVNAEDAVLCAVVHEYGGNWLLASETLAAIPEGGIYRGRHRHPVHCRERFRQLLAQNIAAATGDPSSEKSALHAASNVQLKVTEEHTKRLLDVVQTLPDDELLLPRHFVALLSVVQAQKNVTGQQVPVKLTVPVLLNSPRQQPSVPFTKLHRSYRDEVLIDRLHAGRPNPGKVLAALIESEKSEAKVASTHANLRQLMPPPKDLASSIEDESFSIKDFLVGFTDGTAQPSVSGGSEPAIVQSERPLVSIEDLLGIPVMFPVHPIPTKAVRHVAELLVDQRYRLATKMGLEGSGNEWAAAAGSLTGVVGVQVPTKSKNTGKKRPSSDPSKPPKPKQPHIPKPGKKKEAPGKRKSSNMASDPPKTMSLMRKKDLSAHNGAAPGSLSTSSAIPGQHPAVPRKLPSTIRKTVLDASVDTGLLGRETPGSPKDLEGVQAPGFVEWPSNPPEGNQNDMTVSKSKKSKISVARPGTEGGEKPPPTKEKRPTTPKKLACASQNRDLDSAASSGIGTGGDSEYLGSSIERRIDLNDLSSSDDDVTITGVIPGGAAGRSEASNAPQSQLQLASSALEGLQPRTTMPRQIVGTESPGIRTLRDEFRSPFLSDEIRYSSLRDGSVGTSLLKKHPQSLGGIGSDLQIGLPLTLRGSLMAPGTVGHTESSSSLASAFGNVSLSTKRSDWPPVSASSGWEPFSSLPDFLPMEPSQLQHDPPPLGVWPNPSLVDLESPVQNLRKLSDNVAKRSPSNGAGFIRHEGNRTSGGVSSFQLRCEPAVALGSISPSVVIGSRVADIGAPMIQLRKSTLDNQIQELPDLEMVVNEQHLQSLGNLASRSLPQMQAQSLFSAGFPSASISRGGGNLTQHPFSFAPASPQFPFSTSLKIGQQHLYSSGSQNVELPPDFWPSSSVSFPKQQLYNYQHQHSGEALPTFVGAPVVDQEVSIDLGLSLGPGVPEKQPGARLPRDET